MPCMRLIEVKGHSSLFMKRTVYYLHMLLQFPFKECLSHIKLLIKIEISFRVYVITFSESKMGFKMATSLISVTTSWIILLFR